jgi:aldose 1-epimerase
MTRTSRVSWFLNWLLGCAVVAGCSPGSPAPAPGPAPAAKPGAGVSRERFGITGDGTPVDIFTLRNPAGVEVRAITYGGIITSLKVPDRTGAMGDVVLGFDSLDGYLKGHPFFGAIVGRYGNRIGKARFTLDGKPYSLAANNGPNHLHGGVRGFDKFVWQAEPMQGRAGVTFSRTSPDGEEGYPGNLGTRVSYELTDRNELVVEYHATTDQATPVNLTQHSYFNLAGDGAGDILQHKLTINADRFTPVDGTLIPTGELRAVKGTPFDFLTPTPIGDRIGASDAQLTNGKGYDHNFVLNRIGDGLSLAARVVEPTSGRTLEVSTTEPGVQFYAGNFLDGTLKGKSGHVYGHRGGFCLETQHFPDSPNKANFPSTILKQGQEYSSKTVFTFGVEK